MSVNSNKKVLTFFDIAIMTLTANFGIRWLAVAGGIGPSSLIFWFIGAILFFIPLSIIVAQLAKEYPEEGGLYTWVRSAMGDKSGFIVAWLYWVNNIFYYPAILIFLASNFAYFLGKPELANNPTYITLSVLIAFWLIVIISLFGLKFSKYIVGFGGVAGLIIPSIVLIAIATFIYFGLHKTATTFNLPSFIPGNKVVDNMSSLALIMFAMAGVEVIPTFANSVRNVKRDLYFGLLVGALLIFVFYALGTLSMNVLASPDNIQKASGLIQTFAVIGDKFHAVWFTRLIAFLLTFAELAAIVIWLIAPVVMFFKCTPKGILPAWMHKADKNGTPINAIIFQGLLVSTTIVLTNLLPNVNSMYQILVLMATILYFIPYLLLVVAYVKLSANSKFGSPLVSKLLAIAVFISVTFGIVISFLPSSDLKTTHDIIVYEIELVTGPAIFILVGWFLYARRAKNT